MFRISLFCIAVVGLFIALACLISLTVPYQQGWVLLWQSITNYQATDYQHVIVNLTYLPRLAMAILVGFSMAIAGSVLQFVLRNPIASPTTLGVASGAELGMVAGILFLPSSIYIPSIIFAFLGGCLATILVFLLSSKRGFAPIQMVLAGMVVSLLFGSVSTMLVLLNDQQLNSVFVWGTGALNQNGWDNIQGLLLMIFIPVFVLLLLQRSLASIQLGDNIAKSIGVNVKLIKVVCLALAILMTSAVISTVGIIGFLGIVAPAIARLLGVRKISWQIVTSGGIGAVILLISDLIIQWLSNINNIMLPTGAMTALIGGPFLIWLLIRQRWQSDYKAHHDEGTSYKTRRFTTVLIFLSISFIVILFIALFVGQTSNGWKITLSETIFSLRAPRVFAGLFAGIGLAFAGTMIQRITNNPMASPEVLGISSGAAFALVVGAIIGIAFTKNDQFILGIVGSMFVIALLWWIGKKQQFLPAQLLLAGIALSAALDAGVRIALTSGGENVISLLNWLSGSTYLVSTQDMLILAGGISVLVSIIYLYQRQLDIITIGDDISSSLGMNVNSTKQAILIGVAVLTTLCTIIIGPLSFVGLIAPHMARSFHQYTAGKQLITAAMLGAIILITADWIGRNLWFPWQFPAGLLASVLGGTYFIYLMRK